MTQQTNQPLCTESPPRPSQHATVGWLLLVGFCALLPISKSILSETMDPDFFWHVPVAGQLLRDGIGPITDQFSYASNRTPWTPYSWLAELGMNTVWDAGGLRGVLLAQAALIASFVLLLALACREASALVKPTSAAQPDRATVRLLAAAVATAFGTFLSLPYLSFRPATAALVLLALAAWLLLRDRRLAQRTKSVWLLPPLCILLVNIHLYAWLVPLWIAALFAGSFLEWARHRHNPSTADLQRSCRRYATLLALTALGSLATPMLPGFAATILHYRFADPMVAGSLIEEMQPFWTGSMGMATLLLVLAFATAALFARRKISAGEWLWLLGSILLLLDLRRFIPLFVLIAAPMLARSLPALSDRVLTRKTAWACLAAILIFGTLRVALAFPGHHVTLDAWLNSRGPDALAYPTSAADYLDHHLVPRTARLINEFDWGGYLILRFQGKYQVLLDGRTQLYAPEFWKRLFMSNDADLGTFLTSFNADAAVLPRQNSRFAPSLKKQGWTTAYEDHVAIILLPPTAQ